ncbi:S8 family serine peptidase [Algoriphagus aestuarii]|nr:S8 family serine peptidase [Algoriphagus aestuarii]
MKKLLFVASFLILSFFSFGQKTYVVTMKNTFDSPVLESRQDNPDRIRQSNLNERKRGEKKSKLQTFINNKGIRGVQNQFVDVKVGFVAPLTDQELQNLQNDSSVENVIMDVQVQGRPMMQSDPGSQGRPMMQGRPIMQSEPVDPSWSYDANTKASCAINLVGGSTNSNNRKESIWIVDTGVDQTHKDLKVNRSSRLAASFVPGESSFVDINGHGTHCAGLAAGKGSGRLSANGVSSGAEIIPIKVFDSNGNSSWAKILLALDHIANYGQVGDVVLMSLGSYNVSDCSTSNPLLTSAIQNIANKGMFVVMSAGNAGGDAGRNLPGCIDGQNIFTVGALNFKCDGLGGKYSASNFGTEVDYFVPGSEVFSTWSKDAFNEPRGNNPYQIMSGTSMSAAIMAGIIHATNGRPRNIGSIEIEGVSYPIAGR